MNLKIVKHNPDDKLSIKFVSEQIESRFYLSLHDKLNYMYFLLIENKIVSYINFMDESHRYTLSFLEYWVHSEVKNDLALQFPVLTKKALYLSYVFTDENYRNKHLTSNLLNHACQDLSNEFSYIWLRRETHSTIFEKCGFIYFRDAIDKLVGKDKFIKAYNKDKNYSEYISCLSEHDFEKMVIVLKSKYKKKDKYKNRTNKVRLSEQRS